MASQINFSGNEPYKGYTYLYRSEEPVFYPCREDKKIRSTAHKEFQRTQPNSPQDRRAWKKLSDPRLVWYNKEIARYGKMRDCANAFWVFNSIPPDLSPDIYSYNSLINACIKVGDMTRAFQIFRQMKVLPTVVTYTSLMNACIKSDQSKEAFIVFKKMSDAGIEPTVVTYNSLMNACIKSDQAKEAFIVFKKMSDAGIEPDGVTYNSIDELCSMELKKMRVV